MVKHIGSKLLVPVVLAGALFAVSQPVVHAAPAKEDKELVGAFMKDIRKGDVAQMKAFLAKHPEYLNHSLDLNEFVSSESPLVYAAECGSWESFQLLAQRGAKFNKKTIMARAGYGKNPQIERYLFDKGADINGVDFMGQTALGHAEHNNDLTQAKFLLSLGANPNVVGIGIGTDVPTVSPLSEAIENKHADMVRLLLAHGAQINPADSISDPATLKVIDAAVKADPARTDIFQTKLKDNEILLAGTISSIDVEKKQLILNTLAFALPNGKSSRLAQAKDKTVFIDNVNEFLPNTGRNLMPADFKVGDAILAIGPDSGSGEPLAARQLFLRAYLPGKNDNIPPAKPAAYTKPEVETKTLPQFIRSTYQVDWGNGLPDSAPFQDFTQIAADPPQAGTPTDAAFSIDITKVNTPGKLLPTRELVVYANPGKNFRIDVTVKYNAPVPTKLASNLLLAQAKILPPDLEMKLSENHYITQHFDTQSRPGYQAVEGEGTLTFDLIGFAPTDKGRYTFKMNVGLFDKTTWATKALKFYTVTLITDQKQFDDIPWLR